MLSYAQPCKWSEKFIQKCVLRIMPKNINYNHHSNLFKKTKPYRINICFMNKIADKYLAKYAGNNIDRNVFTIFNFSKNQQDWLQWQMSLVNCYLTGLIFLFTFCRISVVIMLSASLIKL